MLAAVGGGGGGAADGCPRPSAAATAWAGDGTRMKTNSSTKRYLGNVAKTNDGFAIKIFKANAGRRP
jgi:hypothetical protein